MSALVTRTEKRVNFIDTRKEKRLFIATFISDNHSLSEHKLRTNDGPTY